MNTVFIGLSAHSFKRPWALIAPKKPFETSAHWRLNQCIRYGNTILNIMLEHNYNIKEGYTSKTVVGKSYFEETHGWFLLYVLVVLVM